MLTIIAKLMDPLMFGVAFIATLWASRWWHTRIIGFAVACLGEILLGMTQVSRMWGQALVEGWIAYTAHSLFAFWIIQRFRRKRTAKAAEAGAPRSP